MTHNFHFLRPAWFYLLPLLAYLLWLYSRRQAISRSWRAVCDWKLLPHLLIGGSKGPKGRSSLFFMAIGGGLTLFALAGPTWKQLEQPIFRDQSALVLVLDLSRSMDATDIKPSRLTRARHKIIDILNKRREGQTALIIYAADAFVVSPLTQDASTIISQVSALETTLLPRQGSRPDLALIKVAQLLKQSGVPKGHVLMITDGIENASQKGLKEALAKLNKQNALISILGVGSLEGSPIKLAQGGFLRDKNGDIVISKLDETALILLARQGKGHYHRLSLDDKDIHRFFDTSSADRFERQEEKVNLKADRWREEGPWLLLILLPFAALAFRRGHLAAIVLMFGLSLLLNPTPAKALDRDGLWLSQDQRAARFFAQGKEDVAAELFINPEWKAAAHFRAKQYQQSIDALEGVQTPDAHYNRGNAWAQLGRFPEAIQAYDDALNLDPKHEDTLYNREKVLEQMDQKNQDQENKSEGDPSEGQDGDSQGQSEENQFGDNQDGTKQQDPRGDEDDLNENQNTEEAGKRDDAENNREAQHTEKRDKDQSGEQSAPSPARAESSEEDESQLALTQWLRRIPDDPGGLLRRKFLYQSQQQSRARDEEKTW